MGKSLSNRNWEKITNEEKDRYLNDEQTWLIEEFAEGTLYMNNVEGYVVLDRVFETLFSWIQSLAWNLQ